MAVELKTTNLEEIKAFAKELLDKAESAETVGERQTIEADLEETINYYTAVSKSNCYDAAKKSGNPMEYAVLHFFFPSIRVKETVDKDTKVVLREIVDVEKPIDLVNMHSKISGGIGADSKWFGAIQKFNYHLTLRAADRVGAKVNSDAMILNDIARAIELGKNPCSNTQMLKTLQGIVDMMLGEGYKVTSHDVNYLVDCYANDNRKSKTSITLANHKTLAGYLKKICHRILTNSTGYDVVQKEIKEDKKKA